VQFEPVNIAGNSEAKERLTAHGFDSVPAVCRDDDCVPGGDLAAIARLLSLDYDPPIKLTPPELYGKWTLVLEAAQRYLRQAPFAGLSYKSPDRDRTFRELGWHIVLIPRAFVTAYDTDEFPNSLFAEKDVPGSLTGDDIAGALAESQSMLEQWWQGAGSQDPLDRVLETYWGWHSLLEAFEREVWHTAQHTRQVMMFLEQLDVTPDAPLTETDLRGLPLPEGVWD
jgi:DinB superfamily